MDQFFHPFQSDVENWHFWYVVRRSVLDLFVRRALSDTARGRDERPRILDVGCGTGGNSLVLSQHGEVTGLDCSLRPFQLSGPRPYRHRVVAAIERLPFADASFDVVSALDVLEHLTDDEVGAREIFRVLKPGGAAVVFVPAFDILWGRNDEISHHKRRYRRGSLKRLLKSAHFSVENLGYFNLLLFPPTLLVRQLGKLMPQAADRLEYQRQDSALNRLLTRLFALEVPILRRMSLPLGTSVCCIARRPVEEQT